MRPLQMIGLASGVILVLAVGFWYFAYGLSPTVREHARIDSLVEPASVTTHADGVVTVTANSVPDLYRALGFAQGSNRTWASLLLRQVAVGGLSQWFGDTAADIDGHIAALRLGELSRQAFQALEPTEQDNLVAFADGMNAAMAPGFANRLDPLVALRISPEPWEPWHTLAIERLFAWLAADIPLENSSTDEITRFDEVKQSLHVQLGLDGFDRSAAWAFRRNDVTYVHYRLVHGRSALPFFLDVALAYSATSAAGLALAGTPFLIAGKTEQRAWLTIPRSTVSLESYAGTTSVQGARISVNENEHVVSFEVADDGSLVFDSLRLAWSGFSHASDAPAFSALLSQQNPNFLLQDGVMLSISRTGLWSSLANQDWNSRFTGGILVEKSPWTPYHVARLNDLIRQSDSLSTAGWSADTYSTWAEAIVPRLLVAVESEPNQSLQYEAAVTYLRNWDYFFEPSSIAGSILDTWAAIYRERTGEVASVEAIVADSSFTERARYSLHNAVDRLNERFGPDLSTWRWEQSQATTRPYPFASMFSGPSEWVATTRLEAAHPFGVGHPSTLAWGATSEPSGDPPAAWNIVLQSDQWEDWWVQRNHPVTHRVMRFQDALADFETSTGKIPSTADVVATTRLTTAPTRRGARPQ